MDDEAALSSIFAKFGAKNPEIWARSQIEENIPQLHRFIFLRLAWEQVVATSDTGWIARELARQPGTPGGAIAPALQRLLERGADMKDLTTLVRTMQWQLLFRLYHLVNPTDQGDDEIPDIAWGLFELDADGNPLRPIEGLHESVLETDPEGKEMRG